MNREVKKTIYFVRHGQSVDNVLPVFQAADSALSDEGKEQAAEVAERFKHIDFDAIITSPYARAKDTAQAISDATGVAIVDVNDMLVERVKPSSLGGQPHTDQKAVKIWRDWHAAYFVPGERYEDGENHEDAIGRADKVLQYLLDRPETKLVVVTHGFFLRILMARVLLQEKLTGELLAQMVPLMMVENTSVTKLAYVNNFEEEFRWHMWTFGDYSHRGENLPIKGNI